jgi:hypothetical protein
VVPEISKSSLGPGEGGDITAVWKTGRSRGRSRTVLSVVYALDGGEKARRLTLSLHADVVPDLSCDPSVLSFHLGAAAKQVVFLHPAATKPIEVKRAYCAHRAFNAKLSADQSQVEVEFDPSLWVSGYGKSQLLLETDSANDPTCIVALGVGD